MQPGPNLFTRFATSIARTVAKPLAFILALFTIILWLIFGPIFEYSDKWLLIINTVATVVTFLMTFIIQNTQNRESRALHLKVDELIRSTEEARNTIMAVEEMNEADLEKIKEHYNLLGKQERDDAGGIENIVEAPAKPSEEEDQKSDKQK